MRVAVPEEGPDTIQGLYGIASRRQVGSQVVVGVNPAFVRDGPDVVQTLQGLLAAGLFQCGAKISLVERDGVRDWREHEGLD